MSSRYSCLAGIASFVLVSFLVLLPSSSSALDQSSDLSEAEILSYTSQTGAFDKGIDPALAGKPVSLLSGSETLRRTDLTLGSLFPIRVQRSYHGKSGYDSPLGYGWAHNYDKRLYTYPDGSVIIRKETGWKRKFTPSGNGYTTPPGETGTLTRNPDDSFTYAEKDGSREEYDVKGRLAGITDRNGNSLILAYESGTRSPLTGLLPTNVDQSTPLVVAFDYRLSMITELNASSQPTGAFVIFRYDASTGRLTGLSDTLGRNVIYEHDLIGNLVSVTTPALKAVYGYSDTRNRHLITTIDEGEGIYTNTYDNTLKVVKQTHGTGVIDFQYPTPYKKSKVTITVKDTSGTLLNTRTREVEFNDQGQPIQVTDTFGNQTRYTRNSRTWITREERWQNTGTVSSPVLVLRTANNYSYDDRGNMLTRTEGQGTGIEKTFTWTYDPIFNNLLTATVKSVVNPEQYKSTTHSYNAKGNLTSTTQTGLLGDGSPYSHTTSYEYDANGRLKKMDGPRTDVQDVVTATYAPVTGFLTSVTWPIIGTTSYTDHDPLGNPRTVTDPNGNITTYTYDTLGRITSVKAPGDSSATRYAYTTGGCTGCGGPANMIDYVTLPEGEVIDFSYDANGELSKITDSLGNSVNYSYDSDGNRLKEEIKDTQGTLRKTLSFQYDALSRLVKTVNPDSTFTQTSYDALNSPTGVTDPNGNSTGYQYDALSRLTAVIQPGSIATNLAYDSDNNLKSVTDANTNATSYHYDDLGRVYQTDSPDTGTTSYTYDPAGNLKTKTDAKGITTNYSYDAANRLTRIDFPSDTDIVYSYDSCLNGKGRLCLVTDQSGSTAYEYTKKGQIAKETRVIDGVNHVTSYTHTMNGNVRTVIYPSGRVITYNYANNNVTSVLNNGSTLASNIGYLPFGGMTNLTYGNALTRTIGYDNQYRIATIQAGSLQSLGYDHDGNGNVTSMVNNLDNTKSKSYTYDSLNRLETGTGPWGSITWTYDPVGNRLTQVDTSGTSNYNYQTGSNRLSSITGPNLASFGYDENGNTVTENGKAYSYNQNQRLIRAAAGQVGDYVYNALGQRVKKTVGGVTTHFIFDQGGQLIYETASDGSWADYVYLNGEPLAKIDAEGVSYIHTDHLGTPVMMSDSSGAKVWEIEARPFGDGAAVTGDGSLNLRFPGQYYDAESGLNYNYFRDYHPGIGRYVEADPIGIQKSLNHLYNYVQNNPANKKDPSGLAEEFFNCGLIPPGGMNSLCKKVDEWACRKCPEACCKPDFVKCRENAKDELAENECNWKYSACLLRFGKTSPDKIKLPLNPYPEGRPKTPDTTPR